MNSTCPACGAPLGPGDARCPACGLLLVGPAAAELGRVDAELRRLGAHRGVLLDRLRQDSVGGRTAPPPGPAAPLALPDDRRGTWSTQPVLLGLGVLLLVAAGSIFVAVSWRTLSVAGQVAVVVVTALAAASVSRFLETRRLAASAEAVAVLAAGLLAAGLVASRTLGLAGLDEVDRLTYAAGATALLAGLCVLAGLRSASRAWGVLAVAAAVAAVGSGLRAADPGWFAYAAVLPIAGAVAYVSSSVPPRWLRLRGPARVGAWLLVVAGWGVAPLAALDDALAAVPSAGAGLVVAAVVLLVLTRRDGRPTLWSRRPAVAWVVSVAASVQIWAAASLAPVGVRAGLVVAAGTVLVVAVRRSADLRAAWTGVAAAVGILTLPLLTLDLLLELDETDRPGWGSLAPLTRDAAWVSVLVVLAVWVVVGLLVGRSRPTFGPAASGVTALALLGLAAAATSTTTPAPLVVGLAALSTALMVWAHGSPWPDEAVLLSAVLLGEVAACAVSLAVEPDSLLPSAVVLASAGVAALAYGFRPGRAFFWWVGAGAVSAGSWLWLADRDVGTVEAFSLPLAALCLLAGGLGRLRLRELSSWAVAGPALAAGLLPSAVVSLGDERLVRPLLLLAVSAALLLVGVWKRWQALVVVPAAAVVVVVLSQLAPYAVGLPRWLSLGAVGALLLAVGVRYEARRRNAVAAFRWLRALH